MNTVGAGLQNSIEGDVYTDAATRKAVQRDASIFSLTPKLVVYPKTVADISSIVTFAKHSGYSITPRGAGTDMTGGAIGGSIIIDTTRYLTTVREITSSHVTAEPGTPLRVITPKLAAAQRQFASAPTSAHTSTFGGMVANNAGGVYSLQFGNTNGWVRKMKVVLSDGNEYTLTPLTHAQLKRKMRQDTFEGRIYTQLYELIEHNYDTIKNARPRVPRSNSGYALWDVWDRESGIFDLTQLFTGSQGTLGIITEASVETVSLPAHTATLLAYISSLHSLDVIVQTIMRHAPAAFEGFDESGFRANSALHTQLGLASLLKNRTGKGMFFGIELQASSEEALIQKVGALRHDLKRVKKVKVDVDPIGAHSTAFWRARRSALALLRAQAQAFHGAPFIDDLAVPPVALGVVLPKVQSLLRQYALPASIHSHLGDGVVHIIPIGPVLSKKHRAKLAPLMRDLTTIVKEHGGALSGEHNDGMLRGPWLRAAFGPETYALFVQTKEIFDPDYIFNPHKKTDASWSYSTHHLALPMMLDNV
ncbi:TPA: hypothetical protein DD425_01605 [Candidatus Saccharibacteria bacterium]|nr:hypothetical protein [Candidatus Saccharibacteria bacterium]